MKAISILTPTRNRPNNCDRFIKSLYETTQYTGTLELLFYVDSDDPAKDIYKEIEERWQNNFWRVEFVIGEPMSVSKSWNIIAEKSLGDIMIMGNDDLVYKTVRWDAKLLGQLMELNDPYYLTWFNDGINGTFSLISKCIHEIHDGDTVHTRIDMDEKDIDEFIDTLDTQQFERIMEFFNTMPKLRHEVTGKCSVCEKENKRVLEGLGDFFA